MKVLFTVALLAWIILPSHETLAQSNDTQEQDDQEYYSGKLKLRVDGIACPFCSLGLEKKLQKIEGVESVEINVEEAFAVLILEKNKRITRKKVFDEVRKAGFTPVELSELKN